MPEIGEHTADVHDWGAVGLAFAQAYPEQVERLVVTETQNGQRT